LAARFRRTTRTRTHRATSAVRIADLLTAVLAAHHNLTVVHYEADFEIAAEVLAFEHRWILARGSA
jgi:predicted nucleic acid-binding protein